MFCKQFLAYAVHIDWCYLLSINIQVGLNMHLYDDIGDASLSLRGSTSSLILWIESEKVLAKYLLPNEK